MKELKRQIQSQSNPEITQENERLISEYKQENEELKKQKSTLELDKNNYEKQVEKLTTQLADERKKSQQSDDKLEEQERQIRNLENDKLRLRKQLDSFSPASSTSGKQEVILEAPETGYSNFLIVETGTGFSYLFPKQSAIGQGPAKTAKALFKGYREGDTTV